MIYYYKLKLLIPSVKKAKNSNLIDAIKKEDIDSVEKLIKRNRGLVNIKQQFEDLPLKAAIKTGNENITALLIAAGADRKGAIHHAVEVGNTKLISMLLSTGMSIDSRWHGSTPLHHAAILAEVECVEYLIKNGADVNAVDELGYTPLHEAAWQRWTYLQSDGQLILHPTVKFRRKVGDYARVTKILIKNGANVNAKHCGEETPLHIAAERDPYKLFTLSHLKHPSKPDPEGVLIENRDIVKILVENGAELEIRDNEGYTPLMKAIFKGNRRTANLLMEKRARLDNLIMKGKWEEKPKKFPSITLYMCLWIIQNSKETY